MKILAVDTSATVASVAITDGERLAAEMILNHKKTHSETLMPMIDTLFQSSEMKISDIDLFAVSNGPGSFTGLRIGVAAVKALAHACNKPVVGVSTLEAMAYNLPYADGLIAPIMDARREQVYNAVYRWEGETLTEVTAPRAIALADCLEEFREKVYFVGDGVPVYRELILQKLGNLAVFAPVCANAQRAGAVAAAAKAYAKAGKTTTYLELLPVYLRKPQAEREREEMEGKGKVQN
ncbi:MAG: tRNA (adenosine(37)-N6)-threonylcarbamoyltransferase complex dimerization subunit type 1 TsaB [Ruminococcaceae bacterium]|nr:tRNA (adenosine(37)-N6)-threonylcarbamoyltransferase complex dimerization subunit type 1 TsaB [Oscillospiraceae bacterium]